MAVARSKQRSGKPRGSQPPAALAPQAAAAEGGQRDGKPWSWRTILIAASAVGALAAAGIVAFQSSIGPWGAASRDARELTFVGSETCAGCHRPEAELWRGSQHKHAMEHATDKSVLGDFEDASFDYFGMRSRFFRKDGKFLVETDGPDGKLATFEVKYTFGVDPLQQYLIEFPDGRLQAPRPRRASARRRDRARARAAIPSACRTAGGPGPSPPRTRRGARGRGLPWRPDRGLGGGGGRALAWTEGQRLQVGP